MKYRGNNILLVGLGFFAVSVLVFVLTDRNVLDISRDTGFGVFLVNYVFAIGYWIVCNTHRFSGANRHLFWKGRLHYNIMSLLLFWVSCFSLNREITIFHDSIWWLSILIGIVTVTLLVYVFFEIELKLLRKLYGLFLGLSVIILLYYAIYLLPFYAIGFVGSILLGLGAHVFVPLGMLICVVFIFIKESKKDREVWGMALPGFMIPLVCIVFFSVKWVGFSNDIATLEIEAREKASDVPVWVHVSRYLPHDPLTEMYLKKKLIYVQHNIFSWDAFDRLEPSNRREKKRHHPLVVIGDFFVRDDNLTNQDRLKIYMARFDRRHHSREKLWSGDNLVTKRVETRLELFPEYRLAYTEKDVWIKNLSKWGDQEALYTFEMPEGTVVTSLSLWVNGVQEKGILTTKSKADSAYKTIVGVQRRDPSLVTWQEGNTVTVRVYPCNAEEQRHFKIGFTSPLTVENQQLVYQSIAYEGPRNHETEERVVLLSEKEHQSSGIDLEQENGQWEYQGAIQHNWRIHVPFVPLSEETFSFGGKHYQFKELPEQYEQVELDAVYLDITHEWNRQEIENIIELAEVPVFAFTPEGKKRIEKYDDIAMIKKSTFFGLFPFHQLKNEKAMVIVKSTSHSFHLDDLNKSPFHASIRSWMNSNENKPLVFAIGCDPGTYIKSLKEFRAFHYMQGSTRLLLTCLKNKQFLKDQEDESTVTIHGARLMARETTGEQDGKAPDHLMRVYTYNSIMRDIGAKVFDQEQFLSDELIDRARSAYVVTPLSSLIVLETQNDYERFDIKDKNKTLDNAKISSSGAAPEPHEWLLIIIVAGMSLYFLNQRFMIFRIG